MSYVTLAAQYQAKLVEKIQNFLITNHNLESIEFNDKTSCFVEEGYDDPTQKILIGIDEDLKCIGNDYHIGDECDFELSDLSIMELSVIMDYLLEGKFTVLINHE